MKKIMLPIVALLLLVPAVSVAKMKAPDIMDDEKIITEEGLSKYKVVGVKIFSTEGMDYENVDDEEMRKMKRFMKDCQEKLAETIADNLEDYGFEAFVIEEGEGNGKAQMVVEGSFTKVNLGSAVGRFMFFGGGQAGLTVEGKLVDAGTDETLAKFEHENTSGLDQGDKWTLVLHEARDLGDKIADFIHELR